MTQTQLSPEDIQNQIRYVTHEIRNHLSICDTYSQIIRKNLEKSDIKNPSIENALCCIQQAVKIIGTNLLELKSLNTSNTQIFDFEKLLLKGIEMSKAYTCEKKIDYEVFIKNTENIETDETRFLSCIVNIIKNAIEAIEYKGKISIIAEIKNSKGIIKISNDGKPIPKEKQSTIFDSGYTTKKDGCGLGLAICKRYLKEENATLELKKSTRESTTFEITIPTI